MLRNVLPRLTWLAFFLPGAGLILAGLGLLPIVTESINGPRWLLAIAGIPFATAGLYLLSQYVKALGWIEQYVALFIFTCFSILADWIAFGPGDREFESNISFLGGELTGRIAFGIGGIFLTAITVIGWYRVVKYWLTGKKDW